MKKERTIRVAIYTRVSTVEQAREGYSLEAQEKTLRDFCKLKKYEIYKVYSDEGISGKNIYQRPAVMELLSDAQKREFDIILVWKLTRFTRRLSDLTKVCEDLEKWDVSFVSFSESFDCSTPAGKMVRNMLGTIAQFEREVISENVKMAMLHRAFKGKRTCHQVLGYDKLGKDSFVINEEEAEYVRFVFDNYLIYKNLSQVAKLCRERGYRGKRGRIPVAQSIYIILSRPIYCGYNSYCEKMYKGDYIPIITVEQFNRVQSLLKKQGKIIGRSRIQELITIPVKEKGV